MATYSSLSDLLNTTAGMEVLRNNTAQDDGVDTVTGVNWFTFNGTVAKNLYVSGNSYVGFGSNTEHLKVCRRDAKMWYLYRQEGVVGNAKFLKIRWEGYARYNYTSSTYALVWELFLFDDNGLFLNLVAVPSTSGYLGTNTLTCGSKTYSYAVELATPVSYSFLPQNDGSFIVSTDDYPIIVNRVPYGECEFVIDSVRSVTAVKDSYISWTDVIPEGTSMRMFAALTGGAYIECKKDASIPCIGIGDDLSNTVLHIKVEMTTDNVILTPTLKDIVVQIFDANDDNVIALVFDSGTPNSIQRAAGDITVAYDGSGTLIGEGGPVIAFEHSFTPTGLDPKNNPHEAEHLAVIDIVATGKLTRVRYNDTTEHEHVELINIVVAAKLVAIDDI